MEKRKEDRRDGGAPANKNDCDPNGDFRQNLTSEIGAGRSFRKESCLGREGGEGLEKERAQWGA